LAAARIGLARLQPCMAVLGWSWPLAILSCYAQEDLALPWHYAGQLNSSWLCGYGNGFHIFPSCLVLVGKLSVGRPVSNFEGQSYGILMVNPSMKN